MELYLLKSAACLAVLFAFYKVFLEQQQMHTTKRFYLLGSLIAAFTIPLITFTKYIESPQVFTPVFTSELVQIQSTKLEVAPNYLPLILWTIYGLGVVFFSIKFGLNLYRMIQKIRKNPKYKNQNLYHVLLKIPTTPHTFFSYIFLNQQKFEASQIPQEVLDHEATHARELHSLDVFFMELLQILFWFNPLIYFVKKSIKLNHEFLADRSVVRNGVDPLTYQKIVLAFSSNAQSPAMANSINYSSFKKRFTVMKTNTSRTGTWLRSLFLLPLLALLIYGFSSTETIEKENLQTISEAETEKATPEQMAQYNAMAQYWNAHFEKTDPERSMPLNELRKLEVLYRSMSQDQRQNATPFPNCNNPIKATPEQIEEYNKLAKKYNTMPRDNMRIKGKELTRMQYIYGLMTSEQRKSAQPFPDLPPPPEAPNAPEAPKVIKGVNDGAVNIPPPPPPPPAPPTPESPLDHIISMAKKGATFYFEGKKISSDKAIELLKKNDDLNIQTRRHNSSNPQVKISKEPITFDKSEASIEYPNLNIQTHNLSIKTGNIKIGGKDHFYSTKNGITSYFNRHGQQVNKNGTLLSDGLQKNPTFYYNGKKISSAKANRLLKSNTNIQMTHNEQATGEYAVILTRLDNTSRNTNYNNVNLNNVNHNNVNLNNQQDPFIDLTDVIKKGATFYLNDKRISKEKAKELAKNPNSIERVQVITGDNGKPKVYFWNKNETSLIKTLASSKANSHAQKSKPLAILYMNVPTIGPAPDNNNVKAMLNLMVKNKGELFLDGKNISKKEALALINDYEKIEIISINPKHTGEMDHFYNDGKPTIYFMDENCFTHSPHLDRH